MELKTKIRLCEWGSESRNMYLYV